ncbi:MAG: Gfo/Idh/MocA family protein [Armatimonadota bacterium]
MSEILKCAIVGYGPIWNFGQMHARWMEHCERMRLVAVCDIDADARQRALNDWPGIDVYGSTEEMVQDTALDMVTVVTPHFTHADIVTTCLDAGKHVVCEKAMATNVAECTRMVEAAEAADRTLAIHHNRRHDGNYRIIEQVVAEGMIGDLFHVECCEESYGHMGDWWYSDEDKSGGIFFFWGPHAVDWVLNLVPSRPIRVTGSTQRRMWNDISVADEVRCFIWFEGGETAEITFSKIAAIDRPLWRVLGTHGAIEDSKRGNVSGAYIGGYCEELVGEAGQGSVRVVTTEGDEHNEHDLAYLESDWTSYYEDMAAHLLDGAPVPVSAEEGRRTVAVMQAAQESGEANGTMIELENYEQQR